MTHELRTQTLLYIDKKNYHKHKKVSFLQEGFWCDNCNEEIIEDYFFNNRYQALKKIKKISWCSDEKN